MNKICKIDLTNNNYAFCHTEEGEKIFIHISNISKASNKDKVLVEIIKEKEENKLAEAKVLKILEKGNNKYIGVVQKLKNNMNYFFVVSKSLSTDVYIKENRRTKNIKNDDVVIFKIKDENGKNPVGEIIEKVGSYSDFTTKEFTKIFESGIPYEFSSDVIKEASNLYINNKHRKNLNDTNHITIDGSDSKDLDDAIYLEKVDNMYRLYVSIADVSYFVKENSKLDLEARKRGNSTYLLSRVIPMLPNKLCNDVCSLNPNEEKFTFTVEMVFDNRGKLLTHDIYKSSIISKRRYTYDKVNEILSSNEYKDDIEKMLFDMNELSNILDKKREKNGVIDFEFKELKFDLKTMTPYYRIRKESEKLIENFMIACNETVAEYLYWSNYPTVYRVHEMPNEESLKNLDTELKMFSKDLSLPITRDIKPYDIQKILKKIKDKDYEYVLNKMILKSLPKAKYLTENLEHFGLASKYYLHFTSPIRRYADLLVHRYLNMVLMNKLDKEDKRLEIKILLDSILPSINECENRSEKLENSVLKIACLKYMENMIDKHFKGIVSFENSKKVCFELENGIEVVHYKHDNTKYILGDKYNLKIKKVNYIFEEIEVFENGLCEE